MRLTGRAIFSGILVFFFAFFVWRARDWPAVVRLFPWVIGFPMLCVSIALLIGELRRTRSSPDPSTAEFRLTEALDAAIVRERTYKTFAWIFATLAAIWLLGFLIAAPLVVFLYAKVKSREGWMLSLAVTSACWLMLAGLFDRILHLPFPDGVVLDLLKQLL